VVRETSVAVRVRCSERFGLDRQGPPTFWGQYHRYTAASFGLPDVTKASERGDGGSQRLWIGRLEGHLNCGQRLFARLFKHPEDIAL